MAWIFLLIAVVFNSLANIFIKLASYKALAIAIYTNAYFMLGLGLFTLSLIFYTLALRGLNVAVAYPVLIGLSLLVITSIAFFFLGEGIKIEQVTGMLLITLGVMLITIR